MITLHSITVPFTLQDERKNIRICSHAIIKYSEVHSASFCWCFMTHRTGNLYFGLVLNTSRRQESATTLLRDNTNEAQGLSLSRGKMKHSPGRGTQSLPNRHPRVHQLQLHRHSPSDSNAKD